MHDDLLLKYIRLCEDQARLIESLNQTLIKLSEVLEQHIIVDLEEDQERG